MANEKKRDRNIAGIKMCIQKGGENKRKKKKEIEKMGKKNHSKKEDRL